MSDPTIISCLTPPGKGAIAVLALRGPDAWTATRTLFQRFSTRRKTASSTTALPETPTPGQIFLGLIGQGSRDEAVLLVRAASPHSWLEVHCHGGVEVVRLIEEAYHGCGVQVVSWQQFDASATLPVLADTATVRTAAIALDQWHGACARQLEHIHRLRTDGAHEDADRMLARLEQLIPVGRHLAAPWKVVVAGAPNAGKSSLINALAGFARALVSPVPGTTRDVVTTTIALDGWPIELADTAGLRDAAETLEQAGIARARQAIADANLRIWVIDGASAPAFPEATHDWLIAINKCDLAPAWDWTVLPEALRISALTGAGIAQLSEALVRLLVPDPPAPGEAVPITEAEFALVARARRLVVASRAE